MADDWKHEWAHTQSEYLKKVVNRSNGRCDCGAQQLRSNVLSASERPRFTVEIPLEVSAEERALAYPRLRFGDWVNHPEFGLCRVIKLTTDVVLLLSSDEVMVRLAPSRISSLPASSGAGQESVFSVLE